MSNTTGFSLKAHELKEGKDYYAKCNGGDVHHLTVSVHGRFIKYSDGFLFNSFFGTTFKEVEKEEKVEVTRQQLLDAYENEVSNQAIDHAFDFDNVLDEVFGDSGP